MKVLIVAKTRRGDGLVLGASAENGRSVRLIAADAATYLRAGMEYEVGDVWEIVAYLIEQFAFWVANDLR